MILLWYQVQDLLESSNFTGYIQTNEAIIDVHLGPSVLLRRSCHP